MQRVFLQDCRKFLNLLNGMQGDGRRYKDTHLISDHTVKLTWLYCYITTYACCFSAPRVFSYPCLEVFLDKHEVSPNIHTQLIHANQIFCVSVMFFSCLRDVQFGRLSQLWCVPLVADARWWETGGVLDWLQPGKSERLLLLLSRRWGCTGTADTWHDCEH